MKRSATHLARFRWRTLGLTWIRTLCGKRRLVRAGRLEDARDWDAEEAKCGDCEALYTLAALEDRSIFETPAADLNMALAEFVRATLDAIESARSMSEVMRNMKDE